MFNKTLAFSLLAAAIVATPATAQSDGGQSLTVQFDDLNLSTPEGQKALDKRVETAAREVCGVDKKRTGTRIQSNARKQCLEQARASVKSQVAELVGHQNQAS